MDHERLSEKIAVIDDPESSDGYRVESLVLDGSHPDGFRVVELPTESQLLASGCEDVESTLNAIADGLDDGSVLTIEDGDEIVGFAFPPEI